MAGFGSDGGAPTGSNFNGGNGGKINFGLASAVQVGEKADIDAQYASGNPGYVHRTTVKGGLVTAIAAVRAIED